MSALHLRRAWVLNFDAEFELERGARYTPTRAMRARTLEIAHTFATTLDPEDVVMAPEIEARTRGESKADVRGFAWCPTPRALEIFERARIIPPMAPSFETLRRVHDREFAWKLAGGELGGVLRATTLAEVEGHVNMPGLTGQWLCKRAFGVAGRGQRAVQSGKFTDADRAWVLASLRRAPLYIEPRVSIVRELSIHAWALDKTDIRSIREQRVGSNHAWIESHRAMSLEAAIEKSLVDTGERVGRALIAEGYRGPFGVDAYEWQTKTGVLALRTLSEINPRYCMGWDADDGWG
jgi:hypothetical protein